MATAAATAISAMVSGENGGTGKSPPWGMQFPLPPPGSGGAGGAHAGNVTPQFYALTRSTQGLTEGMARILLDSLGQGGRLPPVEHPGLLQAVEYHGQLLGGIRAARVGQLLRGDEMPTTAAIRAIVWAGPVSR
jgi:hypothetical protein